jgi:hypothetical protein
MISASRAEKRLRTSSLLILPGYSEGAPNATLKPHARLDTRARGGRRTAAPAAVDRSGARGPCSNGPDAYHTGARDRGIQLPICGQCPRWQRPQVHPLLSKAFAAGGVAPLDAPLHERWCISKRSPKSKANCALAECHSRECAISC